MMVAPASGKDKEINQSDDKLKVMTDDAPPILRPQLPLRLYIGFSFFSQLALT